MLLFPERWQRFKVNMVGILGCISMHIERKRVEMIRRVGSGFTREKVKTACKMSSGKSGPSEVRVEVLKELGECGIDWLHDIMKDM